MLKMYLRVEFACFFNIVFITQLIIIFFCYMKIPNNMEKNPSSEQFNHENVKEQDLLQNFDRPSLNPSIGKISSNQLKQMRIQWNSRQIKDNIEPNEEKINPTNYYTDESKNQNHSSDKTKKIIKDIKLHNENNRTSGSIASNSNNKLIHIIIISLSKVMDHLNFEETYLKLYDIKGQRQNLIIIPFLVLNVALKQIDKINFSVERQSQELFTKMQDWIKKIKFLFKTLKEIFREFKESLQKLKDIKLKKYATLSNETKQFNFYINTAEYFQVKIPQLFIQFVTRKYYIQKEDLTIFREEQSNEQEIKIQNEIEMHHVNTGQDKLSQSSELKNICESFFEKLFETKQRQVQKAKDKFLSICLNEPYLRKIFDIQPDFRLNIKQILFDSYYYEHRKQHGNRKVKHPLNMKNIYERIEFLLENGQKWNDMKCDKLALDFIIALIVISFLKEKSVEVLNEFIGSIKRKIEFIKDDGEENSIQFQNQLEQFNNTLYRKCHYNHCLNLLSTKSQAQQNIKINETDQELDQKNIKAKKKKLDLYLNFKLTEWIYPPFYNQLKQMNRPKQYPLLEQKQFNLNSLERILSIYNQIQVEMKDQYPNHGIKLTFIHS